MAQRHGLFEDARITPLRIAPSALLAAISVAGLLTGRQGVFMWAPIPINLALAAHGLVCLANGWRGDLVEKRRRLRRPLLAVFALVLGLVLVTQVAVAAGGAPIAAMADWKLINAVLDVLIAAAAVGFTALLLEPSEALLAEPTPAPRKGAMTRRTTPRWRSCSPSSAKARSGGARA